MMNCEGIVDNDSILLEDSFSGKEISSDRLVTSEIGIERKEQNTLEEECPEPVILLPQDVANNSQNINETDVLMDCDELLCNKCGFEGKDTESLRNHDTLIHENRISDEDIVKLGGKILTEFFCNKCPFIADNSEDLKAHTDGSHDLRAKQEATLVIDTILDQISYRCGSCAFSSEDKKKLDSHIDGDHKP